MALNPYKPHSPSEPTEHGSDNRKSIAQQRLRIPVTILVILAVIHFVYDTSLIQQIGTSTNSRLSQLGPLGRAILPGLRIFQIAGLIRLLQIKNYRTGYAAVFSCCLPIITPLWLLGLPFGFWAARLLNDRSIVRAFLPERS